MITILIGLIVGISIFVYRSYKEWGFEIEMNLIDAILGAICGGIIGAVLALALPMKLEEYDTVNNIECLRDNNSIHGSFFLGTGSVQGKIQYVYYIKEGDGFKMRTCDYCKATIKYTKGTPVRHWYQMRPTKSFVNYFGIDFKLICERVVLEVPEGSIQNNYNLDAQ